jgi:hypothetical protein
MWRQRYTAQGVAKHPDLAMRAAAVSYSTGPLTGTQPISERKRAAAELDAVILEAQTRAGMNEAANMGTAGHSLTEPGCAGDVHEGLVETVKGYRELTAGLERVASEVFVANDELRAAGTFDSLYYDEINKPYVFIVGDTKTGKNYHQADFEIQLAVYAGGEVYLGPGRRLTFEEFAGRPVSSQVGYLVHISVTGAPKPRIIELDLARGRRLALRAADTRDARAELDHVGVGQRLDHRSLNIAVLQKRLAELIEASSTLDIDVDTFRARARGLYDRFKGAGWEHSDTLRVQQEIERIERWKDV